MMTSAAAQPAKGTAGRRREGHGRIQLAVVMLVMIGWFTPIYGLAAIFSSHVFTAQAHYLIGSLPSRGWLTLITGCCR